MLVVGLPDFYVARPPGADADADRSFEQLWREHVALGDLALVYRLVAPRWQFLCWLADTTGLLLHGSGSSDITEFEPRQANDIAEFGDRTAVYAASDGLWAMYFALVDRKQGSSLVNASLHVLNADGSGACQYYYFSVDRETLGPEVWRPGYVYVLPRSGFEGEPEEQAYGLRLGSTQWASAAAVTPLARVEVTAADFPLLEQVQDHDQATVARRASSQPDDFPWLSPAG